MVFQGEKNLSVKRKGPLTTNIYSFWQFINLRTLNVYGKKCMQKELEEL